MESNERPIRVNESRIKDYKVAIFRTISIFLHIVFFLQKWIIFCQFVEKASHRETNCGKTMSEYVAPSRAEKREDCDDEES